MLTDEKFIAIGVHMARKLFEKRSRPGRRNVEVHLSEVELAAALALAAEQGAKVAQGKLVVTGKVEVSLPKGDGRQLPSMASIHCGPPPAPPRIEQKPRLPVQCPPNCGGCRGGDGPCIYEDA